MMIAAVQPNQPRTIHVMSVARSERFFRFEASLDVDKQDLKRYSDFVNHKLYDLLQRSQLAANANGRMLFDPLDCRLPRDCRNAFDGFERLDEEIELRPNLDRFAAGSPIDLAYGEDIEAVPHCGRSECRARAYVQHHRPRVEESIERALAEVFSYFRSALQPRERESSRTSRRQYA